MRFSLLSALQVAWICAVLLSASACSKVGNGVAPSNSDVKADSKRTLSIAVIPKCTSGEFWETVESGAEAAREQLGVEMRWDGPLTETEIAEQNKIIENMINLGVDGIALAPLNNKAQRKTVQAAVDAGIPVVIFDSAVDGDAHTSFVATDNTAGGALGADYFKEHLEPGAKILVQRYVQGTASTEARCKGFIDAVKSAGFEVVADPYPEDAQVSGCKKTSANVMEGFIEDGKLGIDGIFACNLNSTLGMADAIDDLRKGGIEVDVKFVGFDFSPKLVDGLRDGQIDALIAQNPKNMGRLAVETLVKHLRGEDVQPRYDTGVEVVTAERLADESAIRELVGAE